MMLCQLYKNEPSTRSYYHRTGLWKDRVNSVTKECLYLGHEPCNSHLANTRAATSYYMAFYSQSGKIKVYILSSQSLFDKIHQGKYVS